MIKEDFEVSKNLIFINDYSFFSIDYIYLFLSQKLKNLKKLIILSLLFATLQIINKNEYKYVFKHLLKLNKNSIFINNIISNYNISKINRVM